jgi:hypothetical protein
LRCAKQNIQICINVLTSKEYWGNFTKMTPVKEYKRQDERKKWCDKGKREMRVKDKDITEVMFRKRQLTHLRFCRGFFSVHSREYRHIMAVLFHILPESP